MPHRTVIKPIGPDWEVDYQTEDGSVECMTVFGQLSIEEVVKEARYSLGGSVFSGPDSVEPTIIAVRRL
jgi:hypothetical protein